jgi:hypothetical protein
MRLLTEAEARHRRNWYFGFGVPLFLITCFGWAVGMCVRVYIQAKAPPFPNPLFTPSRRLLVWILSWQVWGLPIGHPVVLYAPRFPPFPPSSWDVFFIILTITSYLLVARAGLLRFRLAKASEDAQHQTWVDEKRGRRPGADLSVYVVGVVPDTFSSRWYGILLWGIVSGLIYTLLAEFIKRELWGP